MKQNGRCSWDTDGPRAGTVVCSRSGRILGCDREFAEMFGYATPESLRSTVASLDDIFADRLPGAWTPLDTGPEGSVGEFRCLRRDGTSIWIELRARGGTGKVGLRFQATDVTSRDHLEAQLQAARRLDLTGRISAGMTQDIDNLLAAILAQVELAKGSLEIRDVVGAGRELEDLRLTTLRGAQMVRQMLSFNRGESLDLGAVELPEVVGSAARLIRPLLPSSMVFRVLDDGAPAVWADQAAVEQILIRLALQARDAMGDGGRLTIRVGSTRLLPAECRRRGWGIPGEYGSITISDTGVALPDETIEHLFEPFFEAEPGEARGPEMVVVYALMKQHRGFVEVASSRSVDRSGLEPGSGTQVRLLFRPAASRALNPRAEGLPASERSFVPAPLRHTASVSGARMNSDSI